MTYVTTSAQCVEEDHEEPHERPEQGPAGGDHPHVRGGVAPAPVPGDGDAHDAPDAERLDEEADFGWWAEARIPPMRRNASTMIPV
jgi:hypothetical protein